MRRLILALMVGACTPPPSAPRPDEPLVVSPLVIDVSARVGSEGYAGFNVHNTGAEPFEYVLSGPTATGGDCSPFPFHLLNFDQGPLDSDDDNTLVVVYSPKKKTVCEAEILVSLWGETSSDASEIVVSLVGTADGTDNDLDGYVADAPEGIPTDCDDTDPTINPGPDAMEVCDGVDNDCNGLIDERTDLRADDELGFAVLPDRDRDGWGADNTTLEYACNLPQGYVRVDPEYDDDGLPLLEGLVDCQDNDPYIHPGIIDLPLEGDLNCDGMVACYADTDGDGFGDREVLVEHPASDPRCSGLPPGSPANAIPAPVSPFETDCDDTNPAISPLAIERCTLPGDAPLDENCNHLTDDQERYPPLGNPAVFIQGEELWYFDDDRDGYGVQQISSRFCEQPVGWSDQAGDCGPEDPTVHPSATLPEEVDGVDQNCDGFELCYADDDDDTYGSSVTRLSISLDCSGALVTDNNDDCDDTNSNVRPGAPEITANGIDENCDDQEQCYGDRDGDGHGHPSLAYVVQVKGLLCHGEGSPSNDDCLDEVDHPRAARVHPGRVELCNGLDDDCDNLVDDDDPGSLDDPSMPVWLADADADQYGRPASDFLACGFPSPIAGHIRSDLSRGPDCNDADPAVHPGAREVPINGLDDDCDGLEHCFRDDDRDGYGAMVGPGVPELVEDADLACGTEGSAVLLDDCDDSRGDVHPDGTEVCAFGDEDCDGGQGDLDPEGAINALVFYRDADADGFGDRSSWERACHPPLNHVSNDLDCADHDGDIHPMATEVCDFGDALDNDCDGLVDEADLDNFDEDTRQPWYADADRDRWGSNVDVRYACQNPNPFLYLGTNGDCDDTRPLVYPGAEEYPADGLDSNCDDVELCYVDGDEDGVGVPRPITSSDLTCSEPGVASVVGDCDDDDADATDSERFWYADYDGDGEGSTQRHPPFWGCSPPDPSWTTTGTDCDDHRADVNSGAEEVCNGIDDNCDGQVDDVELELFYVDNDGDGFGHPTASGVEACEAPAGYSPNNDDCDDGDASVYPQAQEFCNGLDNDCDGRIDNGVTQEFYPDLDGDEHGDCDGAPISACTQPLNTAPNNHDCDDQDATVHLGADELCDGKLNDCGLSSIDEGCTEPAGPGPQVSLQMTHAGSSYLFVEGSFNAGELGAQCPAGYHFVHLDSGGEEARVSEEALDLWDSSSTSLGSPAFWLGALNGGPCSARRWSWWSAEDGCQAFQANTHASRRAPAISQGANGARFLLADGHYDPAGSPTTWYEPTVGVAYHVVCEMPLPSTPLPSCPRVQP